jgi:hypothetical protein
MEYSRSSIPRGARYFSLLDNVETGYGAHPASYSMVTGIFFQK